MMNKRFLKPLLLMMMIAIFSLNVTGAAFAKNSGSKNPLEVKLTSGKVTAAINKVTLTATAPDAGYGLEIKSIQFVKDQAIIKYKLVQPDPNGASAQVITELKAVTYISSEYKPVLEADKK
jgi:hypothetical protein